jgi:hypothetical protein
MGTRFIQHQRNVVNALINNWIILLLTFEDQETSSTIDTSRIAGYRKKMALKIFLYHVLVYAEVLSCLGPLSLEFQKYVLFVLDIKPAIELTLANLDDVCQLIGESSQDTLLQKYGSEFSNNTVKYTVKDKVVSYAASNHKMSMRSDSSETEHDDNMATKVVSNLKKCLQERFQDCIYSRTIF